MRHSALIIIMLLSMLMMQGCEQGRDLQPQDYFEGKQLDIAKIIYEGDRQKLDKILPTVSKETLNRPAKAEMTLLFWAINNASLTRTRQSGSRSLRIWSRREQTHCSQELRGEVAQLNLL